MRIILLALTHAGEGTLLTPAHGTHSSYVESIGGPGRHTNCALAIVAGDLSTLVINIFPIKGGVVKDDVFSDRDVVVIAWGPLDGGGDGLAALEPDINRGVRDIYT